MKILMISIAGIVTFSISSYTVNADLVKLTKHSDKGFDEAYGWDSGKAPESGNDYLVCDGYYLRGDYNEGFAGDSLQFGIVNGSEGVFFKEHAGTHTFKKLILANGYYRTWMSVNGQAAHIDGNVEVLSPESAPFRIHSTHSSGSGWYITYWDAKLSGAKGTALNVGPYPLNNAHLSKGENIFTGDNSAYSGKFHFYGTNAVAAFTTGKSLGGALAEFKADAITLADGTTLEFRGTAGVLENDLNRGITISPTGGRISIPDGKSLEVEWPIACEGPFVKTGAGTLILDSEIGVSDKNGSAGSFTVAEGSVVFGDSFTADEDAQITVSSNSTISVDAGKEKFIGNICFDGGVINISYDETTGKSGIIVLGEGYSLNGPIPVNPPSVRGIKVPFLKVPVSARALTKDDLAKPLDHAKSGLPSAVFTVETEGEYQVVYAETCNLVTVSTMYLSTENVKKSLLWLSPPVLKWFLTETDLSTLLRR